MMNSFEMRADSPAMVEGEVEIDTADLAQNSGANSLARICKMRRPAAVLVHGEFHSTRFGQFNQPLGDIEIQREGFLTEHMFAGTNRGFDQSRAMFRMQGGIDYLDVVSLQD